MGRNARRRRTRRDPLSHLTTLLRRLDAQQHEHARITFAWDPDNPTHRRRARRLQAEAKRLGYPLDLGGPDAP